MYVYFLFLYFLLNLKITKVSTDFYTSMLSITKLSREETKLLDGLKQYIRAEESGGNKVNDFLKRFVRHTEDEIINPRDIGNPIDAFHLLKRWVEDWEKCFDIVSSSEITDEAIEFSSLRGSINKTLNGWPDERDLDAAIAALFRLWNMYHFRLDDLFYGKIFNFETHPFTPEEIIYIASKAEEKNDMYTSIKFMEALLEEIEKGNFEESKFNATTVARSTASTYNRNGMPWKSVEILKRYVKAEPTNQKLVKAYEYFKTKADNIPRSEWERNMINPKKDILEIIPGRNYEVNVAKSYQALCRGNMKTQKELSKLFCFYRKTIIPLYRVKTELANLEPRIYLFHDIIYDREINFMKDESIPKLTRSTVVLDSASKNFGTAENRISNTAWLSDLVHPLLQRLSKRVEIITGLHTEVKSNYSNSELYQVVNYGIGGMYRPHYDPVNITSTPGADYVFGSGDRIATFMFYLSDVKYGGATVFPFINARIPVQKGSAAFWYNLYLNGETDVNTLHAGCPVLVGSKWVSNKWIREYGQLFRRPCGLRKDDKDNSL